MLTAETNYPEFWDTPVLKTNLNVGERTGWLDYTIGNGDKLTARLGKDPEIKVESANGAIEMIADGMKKALYKMLVALLQKLNLMRRNRNDAR